MMPADWEKVRELFLYAVGKLPAQEWENYVAEACAGDTELQKQTEHLLRVHREAGSFLEQPAARLLAGENLPTQLAGEIPAGEVEEMPGSLIGPYQLVKQIGEGGFGVVFLAEQTQPIRRRVALKILKPGMDTRQVVARFEAERQTLALMDHPHIARMFDGGATATGRPYFVMELVQGIPITDFCRQNESSLRARLELFLDVCQAVQHAHHKGIIHRDLKPSNVLTTAHEDKPVVKVIDFGIGKMMGQQRISVGAGSPDPAPSPTAGLPRSGETYGQRTGTVGRPCQNRETFPGPIPSPGQQPSAGNNLTTGLAQMMGTPLYMSPEQAGADGQDVDTRSDIYSLGVLLYELLTGTTPFDKEKLRTLDHDEIRRLIREQEPPRPSVRLNNHETIAFAIPWQSDPQRLSRALRRELDWIVIKCLQKDRNRRYDSATALAEDLGRFLDGKPILARQVSFPERLGKWVRRRPALAGLIGVSIFSLVVLAVTTLGYSARLRTEVEHAESAESAARRQQQRAEANYQHARETINQMLNRLSDRQLAEVPRLVELRTTLNEDALRFFQAISQGIDDPDPAIRWDVAQAHIGAGYIQFVLHRESEARANYQQAAALLEPLVADDPQHPEYRLGLFECYHYLGMFNRGRRDAVALASDRKTVAFCEESVRLFPEDRRWQVRLAGIYNDLGQCQLGRGQLLDAEHCFQKARALREALALQEPAVEKHQESIAIVANNLAEIQRARGRFAEAEASYCKAAAVFERLFLQSPDDPWRAHKTGVVACNRAGLLLAAGRYREAAKLLTPQIERLEPFARKEPRHIANLALIESLELRAEGYHRMGARIEARGDWQRLAEVAEALDHPEIRAWALACLGQRQEATAIAAAERPSASLFGRARVFAACARVAAADPKLSRAEQARRSQQDADQAWALLRQAHTAGKLSDPDRAFALRYRMDFAILRARPEFQALLRELEPKPTEK